PAFFPYQPACTYCRNNGQGRDLLSPNPSCNTSMMYKQVSKPVKSANVNGPIGWIMPTRITVSTASAVALPSYTVEIASLSSAINTRFATKPGKSCTSTDVLFNCFVISATT